jgi:hypothetical protein
MTTNICVLKLVTGEEVIANLVTVEGTGEIFLEKPRAVHLVPTQNGAAMHLMPWINVAPDASAPISASDIVTYVTAPAEAADAYIRSTSSLDLPPSTGGSIIHS